MSKTILVLTTGGTIGMAEGVKHLPASGWMPDLADLGGEVQVQVEEIFQVGSYDLTPAHWQRLATRTQRALAESTIQGVVITHGTDTMEETAFYLDLVLSPTKPVVLTGAMRPSDAPDSDGPANLRDALAVASRPDCTAYGVLLVMASQVFAAREVFKWDNEGMNSFRSLQGPLAHVRSEGVIFHRSLARLPHGLTDGADAPLPEVGIIYDYTGFCQQLIATLADHARGLVMVGAAGGRISQAAAKGLTRYGGRLSIVIAARARSGRISMPPTHSFPCIYARGLPPNKARIVLMLCLGQHLQHPQIQAIFNLF